MEQGPPLYITVGVTGHRDLPPDSVAPLREAVTAVLARLRESCPGTPVEVLSSLADGADRLCAEVALDMGCRLTVPLPMPEADYMEDFDDASRADYRRLAGRADRVFVAPCSEPVPADVTRPFCYRQAGRYIAGHCHVLLALWDGRTIVTAGGGTCETVSFLLGENPISDAPVWQVVTPRMSGEPPEGCYSLIQHENDPEQAERLRQNLLWTEHFNADCLRHQEAIEQNDLAACGALLGADDEQALHDACRAIKDLYSRADTLSVYYRNRRLSAIRTLSAAGLVLVLLFLGYDNMDLGPALPLYGVVLLLAALYNRVVSGRNYHQKHLTYRLLAEALRVQFFWSLAGIGERVGDQFPGDQREDARWVGFALRGRELPPAPARPGYADHLAAFWLCGQADYHRKNVARKGAQKRFNDRVTQAFLWASAGLFALTFAIQTLRPAWMDISLFTAESAPFLFMYPGAEFSLRSLLKVALGLVSAATAFLANYYGKLSLPSQVKNSRRMAGMYEAADRKARLAMQSGDAAELEQIYLALGREEIAENGSWVLYSLEQVPELIF